MKMQATVSSTHSQTDRTALRAWMRGEAPSPDRARYREGAKHADRAELVMPLRDYNSIRQLRAQSVNTNTAGGFLLHANFEDALEIALLQFDAFRPSATVDRVDTGAATHHPSVNDTSNIGVLIAENAAPGSNDIVAFEDAVLRPQKFSSQFLLLPTEFTEDSGIDLDLWLGRIIGTRIGRAQTQFWTKNVLIPQATQAATAASHTAIGFADVLALEYAVDPAYRASPACGFMCHNSTRQVLAGLVGTAGNPIFMPRRTIDEYDFLDGFPVLYNPYLPSTLAAGNASLFFGDWSRFHIRDVRETRIVRLAERFADSDQVALCGLLRSAAVLLDAGTHPIQYLLQ